AEFAMDFLQHVSFPAPVADRFETNFGVQQFDLRGIRRFFRSVCFFCVLAGWLASRFRRCLLREQIQASDAEQKASCQRVQNTDTESREGFHLESSVEGGAAPVKPSLNGSCGENKAARQEARDSPGNNLAVAASPVHGSLNGRSHGQIVSR